MAPAAAWPPSASLSSIPPLGATAGAAHVRAQHFTVFVKGVAVSPALVFPAQALDVTRVTTTWYYSRVSAWLCSPFSTTTPTRETPGGQAGVESLLCLHCAAWGQPQGGRLHCRSPPLTTCLSWLLQMGGGACQAHEPADRGGHAAGGKSPQRSRPGEAQGEPRGPGARSSGGKAGSSSQHSPDPVLPLAVSVSPPWSQEALLHSPLRSWEGTSPENRGCRGWEA